MLAAALVTGTIVTTLSARIVLSPFGRMLRAVREDAVFAASCRKERPAAEKHRLCVQRWNGRMCGIRVRADSVMGAFGPIRFHVMESVFLVAIVIIGGAGTLWGPVIGASLLIAIQAGLRFLTFQCAGSEPATDHLRSLLIMLMIYRPAGLLGEHGLGRRVEEA